MPSTSMIPSSLVTAATHVQLTTQSPVAAVTKAAVPNIPSPDSIKSSIKTGLFPRRSWVSGGAGPPTPPPTSRARLGPWTSSLSSIRPTAAFPSTIKGNGTTSALLETTHSAGKSSVCSQSCPPRCGGLFQGFATQAILCQKGAYNRTFCVHGSQRIMQ